MSLDLNFMLALDTVVREGSVAKAAQRLHRAQSAISYQIKQLEQQLGLSLLDRDGYRVKLTAAGEVILNEGRRLLIQANQLEALARELNQEWEAKLLVIVDGILPLQTVLKALKGLAQEGAPTRVQVKVEFLQGVQHRFETERADLMLVKDFVPHPHLHAEELAGIECVLCVAPEHTLAQMRTVNLAQLQEHTELSVQDSIRSGNDQHVFGSERVFYLDGFFAKKEALLMGLGYGWMPVFLVKQELKKKQLIEIQFDEGSRYRFTPRLVHRRDQALGRAGRRLTELLRAEALG
ncbi:LysR family transcriptional regulator [Undibacterium fentianense]|uniref:LysR family transcriptional regulator n=1 Tax=Undibacterium fentianense TaxID=2828728 RepID=A0A941E5S7_9BURK|nr:LysR family transcriptional regulator [Undibacterium fentianense]MBR7801461.1 LysR family transcriptional regulator [Undibacterium fentianense]